MSAQVAPCCDEATTDVSGTHPLRNGYQRRSRRSFTVLESMKNPLPSEVDDAGDLKKFFEKWPFVPFAGSSQGTGHSLLAWYAMLLKMSPTTGACINKKADYAFGSAATTVKGVDPEFDTGEERQEATPAERTAYREALKTLVTFDRPLREFCRQLSVDLQGFGNGWMEVIASVVSGQAHFAFRYHRVSRVLYVNTEPGEVRRVAVSPIWTDDYLRKHEPPIIPVTQDYRDPVWGRDEDGTLRTMFHLKHGNNDWYGRPKSESADMNKFSEVQMNFYRIRSAYGEFAGRVIFELEDENPMQSAALDDEAAKAKGYENHAERFRDEYTNAGADPQSFVLTYRPFGAKEMFVYTIPANTNHEFFRGVGDLDEQQIMKTLGVTRSFMGLPVPRGLAGGGSFIEDYVLNMEPIINAEHDTVMNFVNQALSLVWSMTGNEQLNEQSLAFKSPITAAVEAYKKGGYGAKTQVQGANEENANGQISDRDGGN